MIEAKQVFFWTSDLKGHGFHCEKLPSFTNIMRYLCCLQNFIFLESVQYIKRYVYDQNC